MPGVTASGESLDGTMRAAFFESTRTMTVREAPVPEPVPGEVRLRVKYCGICGSDLTLYKTGALAGPDVILGHEISAVVDLDPGGDWVPGTRVAPYPGGRGCGECVWCREGKFRQCLNPPGRPAGGFAEFVVVRASDLIRVPDQLDQRTAAAAEPLGVALRGVALAEPKPGDFAYVSGLGPVGLFVVAGLMAEGCRVLGADPREDRRALGLQLGCEDVFDPTVEDPFSRTLVLDPQGPRMAFECAGVTESLQQVIDACGVEGVVGILGVPMGPVSLLRMTLKEERVFSIQGPTPASMVRALDLLCRRPKIAEVITGTVLLDEIGTAFEGLIEGDGNAKVLVEPAS